MRGFIPLRVLSTLSILIAFASVPGAHAESGDQALAELKTLTGQLRAFSTPKTAALARTAEGNLSTRSLRAPKNPARAAQRRQKLLLQLLASDPTKVHAQLLSAKERRRIPASAKKYIERPKTIEGEFELTYVDMEHGSDRLTRIKTKEKRVPVYFTAGRTEEVPSGAYIQLEGLQIGKALAVTKSTQQMKALALATPNTAMGEQKIGVLLLNFRDNLTQPYTKEFARSLYTNDVNNFIRETSKGKAWVNAEVHGWITLDIKTVPTRSGETVLCPTHDPNIDFAATAMQAAARAGVDTSRYGRIVFAYPYLSQCLYWGLGTGPGNPSAMWINGTLRLPVAVHELGHNLGLHHAHAYNCATTPLPPNGQSCEVYEYGDSFSAMGSNSNGHYNAYEKELLQWTDGRVQHIASSGTFELDPYALISGSRPQALKLLKGIDPTTLEKSFYYIEYRQPIGFDDYMNTKPYLEAQKGVTIRVAKEFERIGSFLLDMTPATRNIKTDAALLQGNSYRDESIGLTITPVSTNPSRAQIAVTFDCRQANPSLTITPGVSSPALPGQQVTYNVTVTNNDAAGCPATKLFRLSSNLPAGWTGSFASSELTLAPGGSGSTALRLTSSASAASGDVSFSLKAESGTNSRFSASASAIYRVQATTRCIPKAPTVTLVAQHPAGARAAGTSSTYTLTVRNNDEVSCGTSQISLSTVLPTGWSSASFSPSFLQLSPGQGGSTTATVSSPASTAPGSYQLKFSARRDGTDLRGETTASYQVTVPPPPPTSAVTLTLNKQSYKVPSDWKFTAKVGGSGVSLDNAQGTFTLTGPNGFRMDRKARFRNNASSTLIRGKFGRTTVAGTYQLQVTISYKQNGKKVSGTAQTTFTVQR